MITGISYGDSPAEQVPKVVSIANEGTVPPVEPPNSEEISFQETQFTQATQPTFSTEIVISKPTRTSNRPQESFV